MKGLKVTIIDNKGEAAGEETFTAGTASPLLLVQAIKVYLSNQRKALAKVKTRGLVAGSKSKIYKQKGTGRARHGDRQAPIFVGGGVSHGPAGNQNYKQRLNQKMIQGALNLALTDKIADKKVFVVKDLSFEKTKDASAYLETLKTNFKIEGKIAFVVTKNEGLRRFLTNLAEVEVFNAESLNPYFLLNTNFVFITEPAFKALAKKQ